MISWRSILSTVLGRDSGEVCLEFQACSGRSSTVKCSTPVWSMTFRATFPPAGQLKGRVRAERICCHFSGLISRRKASCRCFRFWSLAYQAMERRLEQIDQHVGPYRDILRSRLEDIIKVAPDDPQERQRFIDKEIARIDARQSLDLDTLTSPILQTDQSKPALDMTELQRCLENPQLLPNGWVATPGGQNYWNVTTPDGAEYAVTTSKYNYDHDNGATEWWGPGSPAFPNDQIYLQ